MRNWCEFLLVTLLICFVQSTYADSFDNELIKCNQELKQGNSDKALELSKSLIKTQKQSAPAWLCRAKALLQQSDFEQAKQAFQQAIAFESKETERMVILGLVGNTEFQQDHYAEALSYYQQSYDLSIKNNVTAYQRVALNLMADSNSRLNHIDLAKSQYEASLTLSKNDSERMDVLGRMAQMYANAGQYNLAIEHQVKSLIAAERYGTMDEKADIQLELGQMYAQAKDFGMAYKTLNKLLDTSSSQGSPYWQALSHLYLARLDLLNNQPTAAEQHLSVALQLNQELKDDHLAEEIKSTQQGMSRSQ